MTHETYQKSVRVIYITFDIVCRNFERSLVNSRITINAGIFAFKILEGNLLSFKEYYKVDEKSPMITINDLKM